MDSQWPSSAPISRHTFLQGIAAGVAVAGARILTGRSTAPPVARIGQVHRSADSTAVISIDLTQTTGKTVRPGLYGYSTGALIDHHFRLAASGSVDRSARTLAVPLLRLATASQPIIQSVFARGVARPDWSLFSRWERHRADFLRHSGRLVFGIGPAGDHRSISPGTWAKYARATARHFRDIGQPVTYWEVGNECDAMGVARYSDYFNAIADALHSVDASYLVGGPVASWWNGIDLPTFVSKCGPSLGFIDFHSYPVNDTDSLRTAYQKAATFSDVSSARQAVAGTVAADLPIGLLEYNMNSLKQKNGNYGIPAQGKIAGAVYIALLLTQAVGSDAGFTMAALWELLADSNFGAIGNAQHHSSYKVIDEQGWYLRQAASLLPGQQMLTSSAVADLQVLATTRGEHFAAQLVNYSLHTERTVTLSLSGASPAGKLTRWELSASHPRGHATAISGQMPVRLPPQSIVILTGTSS